MEEGGEAAEAAEGEAPAPEPEEEEVQVGCAGCWSGCCGQLVAVGALGSWRRRSASQNS